MASRSLLAQLLLMILTSLVVVTARQTSLAFIAQAARKRQTGGLFQQLTFSSSSSNSGDEQKWEQMYQEYDQSRQGGVAKMDNVGATIRPTPIRVVSFDLDNTLWKTGASILHANNALSSWLDDRNVTQPLRVEVIMGDLFKADKSKYSPVSGEAATLLTLLRTDAMQVLLEQHNGYSAGDAQVVAEQAFDVWTKARHDACAQNLAPNVIDCLNQIRNIKVDSATTSDRYNGDDDQQRQRILVCAITDGNANPLQIEELSPFFDFVVNAENVGVSKPDKRIYVEAIKKALNHPVLAGIVKNDNTFIGDDNVEDLIGPWWVHVGDDFIKDIVAAKCLGMRTVWSRELVANKNKDDAKNDEKANIAAYYPSTNQAGPSSSQEPARSSSTAISETEVRDFVKKIAEMKTVKMTIGSDDYLADSLQKDFSDSIIGRFSDLYNVLADWHDAGLMYEQGNANGQSATAANSINNNNNDDVILTVIRPDEPTMSADKKFCTQCGTSLPVSAKFCSACGEVQS